jgi:hypothetical protein
MTRTAAVWITTTGRPGDHRIGIVEMDDHFSRATRTVVDWLPLPAGDRAEINDRGDAWLRGHGWKRIGRWLGDGSGWSMLAEVRRADPFPEWPLLEETTDPATELPTVREWLDAGAPMREIDQ